MPICLIGSQTCKISDQSMISLRFLWFKIWSPRFSLFVTFKSFCLMLFTKTIFNLLLSFLWQIWNFSIIQRSKWVEFPPGKYGVANVMINTSDFQVLLILVIYYFRFNSSSFITSINKIGQPSLLNHGPSCCQKK